MSDNKKYTAYYAIASLGLIVLVIAVISYRYYTSKLYVVVPRALPPPAKISYVASPAPNCTPNCEWRDSQGDNIWTLVGDHRVIARVFPSMQYPGYWDVADGYGIRHQVSEWGTLESAKAAAEILSKKPAAPLPDR